MAARKFKFVSPGVFLREVDNSQLPKLPGNIGPVIIGRTRKGPALNPVKVDSYAEFVETFGEPIPGNQGDDVWREGNGLLSPAYTSYAAKAYFAADIQSPVTVVRLLGVQGDNAGDDGVAGWTANNAHALVTYASGNVDSDPNNHQVSAIFYFPDETTTVRLTGLDPDGSTTTGSSDASTAVYAPGGALNKVFKSDVNGNFNLYLSSSTRVLQTAVNFTEGSKNYIRSVLNTNPVLTNTAVSYISSGTMADKYWLGETFEQTITTSSAKFGYITRLQGTANSVDFDKYSQSATAGRTGWVFCQHEGTATTYSATSQDRLFRFIATAEGEESSKNVVISIEDIRVSQTGDIDPYGSFTVVVKRLFDTKLEVVESFTGCNLNPNSQNYIAKQIGDQYFQWSITEKRNKVYGNYINNSKYIRVDVDSNVDLGLVSPSKVPWGFYGPIKPATVSSAAINGRFGALGDALDSFIQSGSFSSSLAPDATKTFKVEYPSLPSTISASILATDYFGDSVLKQSTNGVLSSEVNRGRIDYLRRLPTGYISDQDQGIATTKTDYAFLFSLDDVVIGGNNLSDASIANVTSSAFISGSRISAIETKKSYTALYPAGGVESLIEMGFNKFNMPLAGGFDGVNIVEPDPFANRVMSAKTAVNSYAFASVERAIELIKDPEIVEHNLALMPGITNSTLTSKLIEKCESRADSLAIIDLPDVYLPPHEKKCATFADRIGTTPDKAAKALKARQINSSYGASYYPWVKIRDDENVRDVWVPPSVVALGVMAYTEQANEVWFAPAGFNRGGLNEGNAGLPVLQVSEQLLSKQRDTLYETNINPIASFVTEGLVIFGQKTLQSTPSALDRINVRRLLIFVKKEVSRIASGLLFDQNVPATWNRFLGQINPFLQSVKTRLGLADFKVILDNTTTTPDLIDRNVMYAKIFLKPARAIEFIAVDFVITNTGASFDD
tara:strand:- start:7674 stop:10538 length:2865 start_codon:yes stop_codon:yes gene_type:complete